MTLVERLAAKLDIAVDDADRLLEQFLHDARQQLQRGQEVDLPGVGTFQQAKSGDIEFTPHPSLEAIVNYRFAGLSALEVPSPDASDGPVHEAPGPLPTDSAANADPSPPADTRNLDAARGAAEEGASEPLDEDVDRFWNVQRTESPLGPPPQTAEQTSFSVVDGDDSDEDPDQPVAEESGVREAETPRAEEDESADARTGEATFPRKPRSSDTNGRRKLSILAGLLITSGVILLMYFAWFRGPTTSSPSETPRQTRTAPAVSDEDNGEAENTEDESPPSEQTSAEESSPSGNSPFESPLRSDEGIRPPHGGYSWVVASLSDRGAAENIRDTYARNGFRTAIFEGGRGFRVAVGQFETVEDVVATRDELPEDVSSAAWVLKIESNMSPLVSS